jgi:SAM-dependent methyltransferase
MTDNIYTLINEIWEEIQNVVNFESLTYLKMYFHAYSSKSHLKNITEDLELLRCFSPPPKDVLDFGCGIGIQARVLASYGYCVHGLETYVDKSVEEFFKGQNEKVEAYLGSRESSIERVWQIIKKKSNIEFQFYDGKHIPYKPESFDLVLAYAVLEHIPKNEVSGIIKELNRVLKPGGMFFIFQLPQKTSYTEFIARKLKLQAHEQLWDLKLIEQLLQQNHFKIIYSEKKDMIIHQPYKLINFVFPILNLIDTILLHTPLSYFAHHLTVVAQKL